MSLPTEPNRSIPSALRNGDSGWPVFGLQRGLTVIGYRLEPDGAFGAKTESSVATFQSDQKLVADGVAGAKTQGRMVAMLDAATHAAHRRLPVGLLRGFSESEGGNNLGAVNWNVSGGVDCGVVQVRCYGPPFDQQAMKGAYDPAAAMNRVAVSFISQEEAFALLSAAARRGVHFTQRCAALNWNWPWAARQYATAGSLGASAGKPATWAAGIRFPDGAPIKTYAEWAEFYAMGGIHGEGRVTRYVAW